MGKRELSENKLTLPQVKKLLESIGEENLDQFQRRTLDYVNKFSKVEAGAAETAAVAAVVTGAAETAVVVAAANAGKH